MRSLKEEAKKERGSKEVLLGEGRIGASIICPYPMRGYRKSWEYFAILRKDGKVRYDGRTFDSPSAAAKAALGRNANGWYFWRYKDKNGNWVPLHKLKG